MKFVCQKCEAFMRFKEVEVLDENSLGVSFLCPKCAHTIAMVTNPGETNLVHALGVKLGGDAEGAAPLQLTRETLRDPTTVGECRINTPLGPGLREPGSGKCPFSDLVSEMKAGFQKNPGSLSWTEAAQKRLQAIPDPVRSFAQQAIEQLAQEKGKECVDETILDEAKAKFMSWGLQ